MRSNFHYFVYEEHENQNPILHGYFHSLRVAKATANRIEEGLRILCAGQEWAVTIKEHEVGVLLRRLPRLP